MPRSSISLESPRVDQPHRQSHERRIAATRLGETRCDSLKVFQVDEYLSRFADRYSWAEDSKNRLRLLGEETLLILLDQEDDQTSGEESDAKMRRLTATVRRDQGSAGGEFVVVSDDAVDGNLENRLAFLTDEFVLEDDEREV